MRKNFHTSRFPTHIVKIAEFYNFIFKNLFRNFLPFMRKWIVIIILDIVCWIIKHSLSPHFVKILTNTFCWWKNIDGLGGRKYRFCTPVGCTKSAWWWNFPTPLLIFKIAFSSPKKDYPIEKKMCFAYSHYIKLLSISQQLLYNCCISIDSIYITVRILWYNYLYTKTVVLYSSLILFEIGLKWYYSNWYEKLILIF